MTKKCRPKKNLKFLSSYFTGSYKNHPCLGMTKNCRPPDIVSGSVPPIFIRGIQNPVKAKAQQVLGTEMSDMIKLIQKPGPVDISLHRRCRLCGRRLEGLEFRCIGLCHDCHSLSFQVCKTRLPPVQHRTKTGWRGLLTFSQLARWRRWQDEIIERVDRENATAETQRVPRRKSD